MPVTTLVAGSIRLTVPSPVFSTQTDPSAIATQFGLVPTAIVATTEPSDGSTRITAASRSLATQIASSAIRNPSALWPTL